MTKQNEPSIIRRRAPDRSAESHTINFVARANGSTRERGAAPFVAAAGAIIGCVYNLIPCGVRSFIINSAEWNYLQGQKSLRPARDVQKTWTMRRIKVQFRLMRASNAGS